MKRIRTALTLSCLVSLIVTNTAAFAQVDLTGSWTPRNSTDAQEDNPGPEPLPVDYAGIPLSDAGRAYGLLSSPDKMSEPERLCGFYSPVYTMLGPFGLAIGRVAEPLTGTTVAWTIGGWEDLAPITIWMDGRPHPSEYGPHEMSGFWTGTWEDDVLATTTTHMRASILRRNTAAHSDQATMRQWFLRHDDELTVQARIDDPNYLAEPFYITRTYSLDHKAPNILVGQPCIQGDEGVPESDVPHNMPGKNPDVPELTEQYGIPREAVLGGPETMYPDFRKKIASQYVRPEKCPRVCGGPGTYPRPEGTR